MQNEDSEKDSFKETMNFATTTLSKFVRNDKVDVRAMINGIFASELIDIGATFNHAGFE